MDCKFYRRRQKRKDPSPAAYRHRFFPGIWPDGNSFGNLFLCSCSDCNKNARFRSGAGGNLSSYLSGRISLPHALQFRLCHPSGKRGQQAAICGTDPFRDHQCIFESVFRDRLPHGRFRCCPCHRYFYRVFRRDGGLLAAQRIRRISSVPSETAASQDTAAPDPCDRNSGCCTGCSVLFCKYFRAGFRKQFWSRCNCRKYHCNEF